MMLARKQRNIWSIMQTLTRMANSRNTRILFVLSFILRDVAYPRHVYRYAEKLCADFKKLKPSADALAELMLSYMENAIEFTHDFGDMSEQYYVSVEGNFAKTVEFIAKNGLWEKFENDFSNVCLGRVYVAMVSLMVLMTYTRRQGIE